MVVTKNFSVGRFFKKAFVPVGAAVFSLVLASALTTEGKAASTGTSWAAEPSWASSSGSSLARRPNYAANDPRNNLAPFSPGSNNLAIDVGQVFLMGDLAGKYNDNIGAQLHYTYGVSDLFDFDSSLGYSEHSDGKFSMGSLLTGLRTNLAWYDKVVPYAVFGMGFYKPSFQILSGSGPDQTASSLSPILFGVHLGAGLDLELTKELFFGAGLTFHDVFGGKRNTVDGLKDVGGTYTSFLLHVGVTF